MAKDDTICASILISTEDGSVYASSVVRSLVIKMLQVIDPSFQSHRFAYIPSDAVASRANAWKGKTTGGYRERIDFFRSIAGQLMLTNPRGFVVVHLDADTTWSNRAASDNLRQFYEVLVHNVEHQLIAHRGKLLKGNKVPSWEVDVVLSRLIAVSPCYSIEAWLYQNTHVAAAACRERGLALDAEKVEYW